MLHGMLTLLHAHVAYPFIVFDNGFGHALEIDAASEAIRAGCAEAMERGTPLRCLSFLSLAWQFAEEKGQHEWKRMDMCRYRWKDRRLLCPIVGKVLIAYLSFLSPGPHALHHYWHLLTLGLREEFCLLNIFG